MAREGNPWPYVEWQWGKVITGEEFASDRRYWSGRKHLILDSFQRDTISAVLNPKSREVWVKGATGTGKGAAVGLAMSRRLLTRGEEGSARSGNSADSEQ